MSIIWTVGSKLEGWYRTAIKLTPLTRIHIFWRGDKDRAHHDHPNDFWTFPLIGYYEEVTDVATGEVSLNRVTPWRWHFRPAEYRHRVLGRRRIVRLDHVTPNTWDVVHDYAGAFLTVVRERPARRKWGFYPNGQFVYWRDYLDVQEG